MPFLDANVILFKCNQSKKSFGVRVERTEDNDWIRTWSFPVDDNVTKNEKYDAQEVSGSFNRTSEYPGCPYCETQSFFKCSCGKITCLSDSDNEEGTTVTCEWCGESGSLGAAKEKLDISSNSF